MPAGWHLIDIEDVWLGAPALAGQVAAADYRIELGDVDAEAIAQAAGEVLARDTVPRERMKAGAAVQYDLRPLLVDAAVVDAGPPVAMRTRTRFDPVLGRAGRRRSWRPSPMLPAPTWSSGRSFVSG